MTSRLPVLSSSRLLATAVLLAGVAACASRGMEIAPGAGIQPVDGRPAAVSATANRFVYTQADVQFMAGMIPHHAQAIRMARWAPTHSASREVRMLAERIVVSQRDEIGLMQFWLRERGERVPAADATHHRMTMAGGMEHDMLMPGMLTDDELARLERARGNEFDRMFLTFMIRHHDGALTMVEELFAAAGAAHDDVVYTFASDVWADQTSEIDRMEKMLAALPAGGASR